jgi:hypothetical protein
MDTRTKEEKLAELNSPRYRNGVRFSEVLVDPARFEELVHSKGFSCPNLVGSVEHPPAFPVRFTTLPAEAAKDPAVFACIVGKDPFAPTALVAFAIEGKVVRHYNLPGRPRPTRGEGAGMVDAAAAGV